MSNEFDTNMISYAEKRILLEYGTIDNFYKQYIHNKSVS